MLQVMIRWPRCSSNTLKPQNQWKNFVPIIRKSNTNAWVALQIFTQWQTSCFCQEVSKYCEINSKLNLCCFFVRLPTKLLICSYLPTCFKSSNSHLTQHLLCNLFIMELFQSSNPTLLNSRPPIKPLICCAPAHLFKSTCHLKHLFATYGSGTYVCHTFQQLDLTTGEKDTQTIRELLLLLFIQHLLLIVCHHTPAVQYMDAC